jgi:hypothetical protein
VRDEQTTTLIWVLAAVAAVGIAIVAFFVVMREDDDDPELSREAEILREIFTSQFGGGAFDDAFLDENYGFETYESFEEAEDEAGYQIARPGDGYVLLDGVTYLESYLRPEDEAAPVSRSHYISRDGDQLALQVFPSTYDFFDRDGPSASTTVGGKDGWTIDVGESHFFAWDCGATDTGTDLYCTATAEGAVDRDAFEAFVASVR